MRNAPDRLCFSQHARVRIAHKTLRLQCRLVVLGLIDRRFPA